MITPSIHIFGAIIICTIKIEQIIVTIRFVFLNKIYKRIIIAHIKK